MTKNSIFTVNVGSSSLKLSLYEPRSKLELRRLLQLCADLTKTPPQLTVEGDKELSNKVFSLLSSQNLKGSTWLEHIALEAFNSFRSLGLSGIGHRIVHGGAKFKGSVKITSQVIESLEKLIPFAPLHQAPSLNLLKQMRTLAPDLFHVACFDTTFHQEQPSVATRFALPREYEQEGVRRYGFHGLSYESIIKKLRKLAPDLIEKRLVVAHLGSGASLSAIYKGKSIETTMGFSALDGVPMATRCGSLDVGVILYLFEEKKMLLSEVQDLLYHHSGLLGVSGVSGDVRTLLASDKMEAKEALELFVYHIVREIGGLSAALGGVDGLIFTAGIGQHCAWVRQQVCCRLEWLGVELDLELNNSNQEGCISTEKSTVKVWIIPTDEEGMIAHHTYSLFLEQ
jgi:acetate kinase